MYFVTYIPTCIGYIAYNQPKRYNFLRNGVWLWLSQHYSNDGRGPYGSG